MTFNDFLVYYNTNVLLHGVKAADKKVLEDDNLGPNTELFREIILGSIRIEIIKSGH